MIRYSTYVRLFLMAAIGCLVYPAVTSAADTPQRGMEVIVCNPLLQSINEENTWEAAKAIGIKGLELSVGSDLGCPQLFVEGKTPYTMDTPDHAKQIRNDAQKNGLMTPVVCSGIGIDPSKKASAPEWALKLIENAPDADVKLIYFPLRVAKSDGEIDDNAVIQHAIAVLKELVAQGQKHGVEIAIENLQHFWNRPDYLRPVLKTFTPDEFGLCLDPINLYWYGFPRTQVYEFVTEYIPRTKHFHAKNVAHPKDKQEVMRPRGWEYGENSVPVAEGDIDFKAILTQLYKAGYRGYVSIEDDSLDHYPQEKRVDILRQDVQYLRSIVDELSK